MAATARVQVPRLANDLLWVARHTAAGIRAGLHRTAAQGGAVEFSHLRPYRPGDDLKHIDWKGSARTSRLLTRVFTRSATHEALLVLDGSSSMAWGEKPALLRTAAAVLATLLLEQGDAAGWLLVTPEGHRRLYPVRGGAFHLSGLVAGLARLDLQGTAETAQLLHTAGQLRQRRSTIMVFSDFYDDEAMRPGLRQLAARGHEVVAVHLLTDGERTLPETGAAEYVDAETGQRVTLEPRRVRSAVARRIEAWRVALERDLRRAGIDYVQLPRLSTLARDLEGFLRRREAREAGA